MAGIVITGVRIDSVIDRSCSDRSAALRTANLYSGSNDFERHYRRTRTYNRLDFHGNQLLFGMGN